VRLRLTGYKGRISFPRFLRLDALCTLLPLVLALAVLLAERKLHFF
jgi:hypothetical protein